MAIYAWSDLHTDYPANLDTIRHLDKRNFRRDTLLVGGDVSDNVSILKETLSLLNDRFLNVFFVPGNHDLWLQSQGGFPCSSAKYRYLLNLCANIGVYTESRKIVDSGRAIWIVPLMTWYTKPEEGDDSLYVPKDGEDPSLRMWMDNYRIRWTQLGNSKSPGEFFDAENRRNLQGLSFDAPVISFSHFLPSRTVLFPGDVPADRIPQYSGDPYPEFNFTRVAGSSRIQGLIDQLGSTVHYYGHQHRNRRITIGDCLYVSHCMGYPEEPKEGPTGDKRLPAKIWPVAED